MANKRTFVGVVGIAVSSLILTACGGGGSSGGEEGTVVGVQGGTQVVAADVIAEAQEQRESNQDEESGPQTLSTDDVEVEELNEAPAEEEVEDGIEVSEAEEDPLDGLLNAVATFQGCLEDDGFEFIGAPVSLVLMEKPLIQVNSRPNTLELSKNVPLKVIFLKTSKTSMKRKRI